MKSPGAPALRREIEREFWREIATGITAESAAAIVGVSQAAGARWFRQGGGMPTVELTPLTGRYLSFSEREEIAFHRAQGCGVREIARQLRLSHESRPSCSRFAARGIMNYACQRASDGP
jgi:hypothetical protein